MMNWIIITKIDMGIFVMKNEYMQAMSHIDITICDHLEKQLLMTI